MFRFAGVLGAGKSGLAAAGLLRRVGVRVLLSEKGKMAGHLPRGVEKEESGHSRRLLQCDVLVRSPGVPGDLPILKEAVRRGIPVWSELELASRWIRPRRLVAITGTNGKTTTTTLVGELFKAAGDTLVAGNIGKPLAALVGHVKRHTTVVLEVSSYQLENIQTFHPTISAILNLTPDHLEHHGSMRSYAAAKARIFENQTAKDVCVLNADDAWCRRLAKHCRASIFWFSRRQKLSRGIYYEASGVLVLRWGRIRARWRLDWSLPGPHNIENALAAVAVASAGGIPLKRIQRVLHRFQGVEHRLEPVRTLHGVRYVNDSKGTNVDSTRMALASFKEPLVVIMGGQGKGTPYTPLRPLVQKKVRRVLLIGEDAPRIRRALVGTAPMENCRVMPQAVRRARHVAQSGEVVLLSPACASFDQYKNYEERGRHFKQLVWRLK